MRNLLLTTVVLLLTVFSLQAQINLDVEGDGKISGGLTLGNTSLTTNGTLRYNGSDIEARLGGIWTSLTAGGGSSLWSTNGTGINYNSGNVGIGPIGSDPDYPLTVHSDGSSFSAIFAKNTGSNAAIYASSEEIGFFSEVISSNGGGYGIQTLVAGTNGSNNGYGIYGSVSGGTGTGTNYGVYGEADKPNGGRSYGVYANGNLKATDQLFVNTSTTIEDANPNTEVLVTGEAKLSSNTDGVNVINAEYTGAQSDAPAIEGKNESANNYGVGVKGIGGYRGVIGECKPESSANPFGVFGNVSGTSTSSGTFSGVYGRASGGTTGDRYGVYGYATKGSDASSEASGVYGLTNGSGVGAGVHGNANGTGVNIGVLGEATGGSRNYAMLANGDLKVNDQIFIGTATNDEDATSAYKLVVAGKSIMEELIVELKGNWPDYVFENEYDLKSLTEVENFIEQNGHLPNVPSAEVMEASDGIAVGEMQRIMMEKIEELTLYTIDQEKRMKQLEEQNEALVKEIENLKK